MRTRICPKCGRQMSGHKFVNNMYYEYLEFTCLCGYIKSEPTLDNQEGDGEEHAKNNEPKQEMISKSQVREAIERAIEENQLIVEKADEKLLRGECDKEFFTEEDAFLMIEKRLSAVDALTALSKELGLNQEARSSEEGK